MPRSISMLGLGNVMANRNGAAVCKRTANSIETANPIRMERNTNEYIAKDELPMLLKDFVQSNFRWPILLISCLLLSSGCGPSESREEVAKTEKTSGVTNDDSAPTKRPNAPKSIAAPKPDVAGGNSKSEEKTADVKANQLDAPAAQPEPKVADVNDPRFHPQLLEAVDEYLQYTMVNLAPMVAPTDCRAPELEPRPKVSEAEDGTAHGKKLYFLFAKDLANYTALDAKKAPAGQVLVKESWSSKPSNANARNMRTHASAIRINPRVNVDGETLTIGKRTDLFVMLKLDPKTEGTDEGWVYGVVDADSRSFKSAGKVASCMECHVGQSDRLFRVAQAVVISEEVVEPSVDESKDEPKQDKEAEKKDETTQPKDSEEEVKSNEEAAKNSKEENGDGL